MVRLSTLGTLDLRGSDDTVVDSVLSQPKRLAVLLYLALASPRGFTRRDTLLALFWPDSDAARARNSLSQSLSVLRKALGEDVVVTRGQEEVGLDPDHIWCDAVAFDETVAEGRLEEALVLYHGDLVPGFHVDASTRFDQWLETERKRLRQVALGAARTLSGRARDAGEHQAAVRWARRARAIAPLSERVVGELIDLLGVVGDRTAALDVFHSFEERLAAEYELEPSPEMARRVQRILDGSMASATAAGAVAEPARDPEPRPGESPSEDRGTPTSGPHTRAASEPRTAAQRSTDRATRTRRLVLAVLALLVVAAVGFIGLRSVGFGPVDTLLAGGTVERSDQILITDFASPEDELLGATTAALLRTDFSMSDLMDVPEEWEVAEAMDRMRRGGPAPDSTLAIELAIREGYELVVLGEIAPIGSGYVITARLVAPETGEVLGRFRKEAKEADDFVDAVDALSADIHRRIGESRAHIRRLPPLAQVSTPSLDALKAYTEAIRLRDQGGRFDDAAILLERAIEIDSTFGAAYTELASTLPGLPDGDFARIRELQRLADRYRDRMTPMERLRMEVNRLPFNSEGNDASVQDILTHYTDLARLYEGFLRTYPEQTAAWITLGDVYHTLARHADAIDATERALRLRPENQLARRNLFIQRLSAGDTVGAVRTLTQLDPGSGWRSRAEVHLAMARERLRRAHDLLVQNEIEPYLVFQLDVALGRFDEAEEHLEERMGAVPRSELARTVLIWRYSLARGIARILPEREDEARRTLLRALEDFPLDSVPEWSRPVMKVAGVLALLGDTTRARRQIDDAARLAPWHPIIPNGAWARANLLSASGHHQEAIRVLRNGHRALPIAERELMGALADAHRAAGQADSAIATYERLLDSTVTWGGQIGYGWLLHIPLAHRALGELYEERGDTARAVEHYARLIELWRDADPEVQPQVEAARERLSALASGT